MKRVYNFSAGPAMLPECVLREAADEMLDAAGSGQSVMEMSHRAGDFKVIIEKAETLLRSLLGISTDYEVLFLQGGASLQFAMVPINLAGTVCGGAGSAALKNAAYIDTGVWAGKAAKEAAKYVKVNEIASSKDRAYAYIPACPPVGKENEYLHICLNNTIVGTAWHKLPEADLLNGVPLVADVSSCILSAPLDVSRFGLIYAGAQKNMGPAGCTVVIIRRDLAKRAAPEWAPLMLRYDTHIKERSLFNTPPCWCIYIIMLVLQWLQNSGGLKAIEAVNRRKAGMLYKTLENSKAFYSPVEEGSRSMMNVPFLVRDEFASLLKKEKKEIEADFLRRAAREGLVNLAGHRLVGGLRASIYNAMPEDGVKKLCAFIKEFENV